MGIAMFGDALKHLLENDLTTRKEIQTVTGRGASTIYRWLSGETEPQYQDIRALIRGMRKAEARRSLVGLLTGDLPLTVNWLDDEIQSTLTTREAKIEVGEAALDSSLLALECLSELLIDAREALRNQRLPAEQGARVIDLCDQIIRHLTGVKNSAAALIASSKQAKPAAE